MAGQSSNTRAIIAFARETWRNDGAEGETVHKLCDLLEGARAELSRQHSALSSAKKEREIRNGVQHLQHALRKREAVVARLRTALEWYANSQNVAAEYHEPLWAHGASVTKYRPIDDDEGQRARDALDATPKSRPE